MESNLSIPGFIGMDLIQIKERRKSIDLGVQRARVKVTVTKNKYKIRKIVSLWLPVFNQNSADGR